MTSIRYPSVAGLFYPADAESCQKSVAAMLAQTTLPDHTRCPKALIVPHAGWQYSGAVAAAAYRLLEPHARLIKHVVLLGPCHRLPLRGIVAPSAAFFQTPLGTIPVDTESVDSLEGLNGFSKDDIPHDMEHSLEVQLPFLQMLLRDFKITPLVVGDMRKEQVAKTLELLWGDDDTLVIVSTDLSHYLPYADAVGIDEQTGWQIVQKHSELDGTHACGSRALNGLLYFAEQHNLTVSQICLTNSGDSFTGGEGDKSRVVGYGAFAIN